ncbi:MAG: ubiquinol-cytochrome c reductase iron-sulfur subunit [Nitrospiraceae bacterium]
MPPESAERASSHDAHAASDGALTGTRRRFFSWVTTVAATIIGLGVGIPLIGFIVSPALKRRERPWVDLGPVSDVPLATPTQLEYQQTVQDGWFASTVRKGVWAVRQDDHRVTCFSPMCTHLGCGFAWDQAEQVFKCPCHGSVFEKDGRVKAGPAPRPLDVLPTKIEDGRLHVVYKEFKAGLPTSIEL